MSRRDRRRELTPQDKGQHGDPVPVVDEADRALTADELVGRTEEGETTAIPVVEPPQVAGPIAMPRVCANCRRGLPLDAATCSVCAPDAKVSVPGGVNGVDLTSRTRVESSPGTPPWWLGPIVNRG